MKIKCGVCGNEGYLQHIGPNYYRIRHYVCSVDGKPRFEYHKQSFEYVQRFLNQNQSPIDLNDPKTIDPMIDQVDLKVLGNVFKSENQSSSNTCSGSIVRSSIVASRPHKRNNREGKSRTRVQIPAGAPLHG